MVYSKSKSICFSASSWSRIYLRTVSSSKPTVLTQHPRLQKCLPFVCLFLTKYRWILTALLPFRNPITNAILNLGGTLRHIWIWSGLKFPSNNSTPRCRHRSFIISPTCRLNFPYSFLFRYFGTIITWYFQSQRTCDKLCQSCIGFSSFILQWSFPGGKTYFISRRNGRTFPGPPLEVVA